MKTAAQKRRSAPPPPKRAQSPGFQIVLLTAIALTLYAIVRQLPTGTHLSHLDFRTENGNPIEFCDPSNPQFIPVSTVQSPVTLRLKTEGPPAAGSVAHVTATFTTASGKSIGPADLLVTHTEKLHLLVFDPELRDYQHVHPKPGARNGDWTFSFLPRASGDYRIYADFTPAATGRGLYAAADLQVAATPGATPPPGAPVVHHAAGGALEVTRDGLVFSLLPKTNPLKAREISEFDFSVRRANGGAVRLQPVMDAYAHLVAVDSKRSGFAHLHPTQLVDPSAEAAPVSRLNFKITIPQPGRYVIWAQIRVDDHDAYAPFWFDVTD